MPHVNDFGLAKQLSARDSITRSGAVIGTPAYMSPEQVEGDPEKIGSASDQYSLGVILYESLTGRPLFSGSSDMGILERVREAKFVSPSAINPAVPIELEAVVTRALQVEPEDRYQDASEMLLDPDTYLRRRPAVGPSSLARFVEELFASEDETAKNPVRD